MARSKEKKRWFTVAYLTAEGVPHPAHRAGNFTRVYRTPGVLRADLVYSMTHELGHRGAAAAAVWAGELSEWEALRGPARPLYYVHQGGQVERL